MKKKTEIDICERCNVCDTLEYHFIGCKKVKNLWILLRKWKTDILGVTFDESIEEKLIGIQNIDSNSIIEMHNYVNMCLKTYIREKETNDVFFHVFI